MNNSDPTPAPSQPQEGGPFHPDTCPTHPMTRRICPLCQPQEAKAESGERSDPAPTCPDHNLPYNATDAKGRYLCPKCPAAPSQAVPIADLENLLNFISHKRGEIMDLCVNPGRLEEVIESLSEYVVKSKGEPQAHAGGREPGNLDGSRKPLPGASRQEEEE